MSEHGRTDTSLQADGTHPPGDLQGDGSFQKSQRSRRGFGPAAAAAYDWRSRPTRPEDRVPLEPKLTDPAADQVKFGDSRWTNRPLRLRERPREESRETIEIRRRRGRREATMRMEEGRWNLRFVFPAEERRKKIWIYERKREEKRLVDEDEKEEEKTRTREKRLVGKWIPHRNSSSTSSTCQKKNSGSRVLKTDLWLRDEGAIFHS